MRNLTDEMNNFYYRMSLHELQMMNEVDLLRGVSYNSLLYLNVIDQIADCTVSKMAEALHVTKSAVTLKINDLVRQGLVEKVQSEEDRRVFYLRLSGRIEKSLRLYDLIFEKIGKKLEEKYTEKELELFGNIFHDISGYDWKELDNE